MRPICCWAIAAAAGTFGWMRPCPAADVAAYTMRCEALAHMDFTSTVDAPTHVTKSISVMPQKQVPAYCLVEGHLTPELSVEVRLPPADWNGKFLAFANVQTGDVCNPYLKRGYACMAMFRTFKKGQRDRDWFELMQRDLRVRRDVNRAPHLLTLAGKALVTRFYSQPPTQSYFMSCSGGGHSGMLEAQTFPQDYDGLVVGAPSLDEPNWLMRIALTYNALLDERHRMRLSVDDARAIHLATLAACDRDDGVEDGIISHPLGCRLDLSRLLCAAAKAPGCLLPAEIAAAKAMYGGPSGAGRNALPGAELGWRFNVSTTVLGDMEAEFRLIFDGASPALTPTRFDFARDYQRQGLGAWFAAATNPDLRAFKSAGGKLIAYLGGYDNSFSIGIIDYYETVERAMGGRLATQDFFRFFLVPGMTHCVGGPGADAIDYLSYLEAWVERGQAPDVLVGAHVSEAYLASLPLKPSGADGRLEQVAPEARLQMARGQLAFPLDPAIPVTFTRPIYPFPLFAKYKGNGDPNDAANFVPIDPSRPALRNDH